MRHLALSLIWAVSVLPGEESLPDTRLGALPQLPSGDPVKVALGRQLFFDPVLSATGDTACASCHHPQYGWADGRPTSLGVHAVGLGPERRLAKAGHLLPIARNAPTILNVAYNGIQMEKPYDPAAAPMFWDNRVMGLENQALVPLRSREEMRGDVCSEADALSSMTTRLSANAGYRRQFVAVFSDKPKPGLVAQAIAAFERSLVTLDTPFDRFMRGDKTAMTPLQQRGMEVFHRAGCSLCHNGPMLSDYKLHAVGVTDVSAARQEFRTPSLRNLQHTAPYMHNGSMKSIADVLLFYDLLMDRVSETIEGGDASTLPALDPLLRRMNFLPEDHEPLAAFLESLSSTTYDKSVPAR